MKLKRDKERVRINISGEIFETYRDTLIRFPRTLLGEYDEIKYYYVECYNEYFFDRCRQCFGAIIFFYQSNGILSCPLNVNVDIFVKECEFFKIPYSFIVQMKIKEGKLPHLDEDEKIQVNIPRIQTELWFLLDYPESSEFARIYALISSCVIVISILCACLETIPNLHESKCFDELAIVELVTNIFFLVELVLRFLASPSKKNFIQSILNWIDASVSIPYFAVPLFSNKVVINIGFLRILKFVRVMRLFRLSKHSKRLKVVGEIIKSSIPDFQLLLLCFGIAIIFGGSFVYFTEKADDTTDFISIPSAFWWAIQTVTTVGYGDIVPQTVLGRLVAAMYSILGVMTLSLPVLAIVTKFVMFYERNVECSPLD